MIALYLDEDTSDRDVVFGLRSRQVDVLTVAEAGRLGRSDLEQLEFATASERAIYTANVAHYNQVHAEWLSTGRQHHGIVLLTWQRMPVRLQLRALLKLVASVTPDQMRSRQEFLNAWF